MATKIKVKKITDLDKIYSQPKSVDGNVIDNNGILSGDQIIVAHKTNEREDGSAVFHTTVIETGELLEYLKEELNSHFMQLDAAQALSNLIDEKLKEAEDNMSKGNDVYSSNYYMDDSGIATFGAASQEGQLSVATTTEYIFKSTCMANVHLTIYNIGAAASTGKPTTPAYAQVQMLSKSGWKTICQQPVQNADGAFDIDLHGYFYAGTKLRGRIYWSAAVGTKANVSLSSSNISITRFSSNTGFEEKSFDWWVTNDGLRTSSKQPPQDISADGFLNFSGLYWSGKDKVPGSLTSDYLNKSKNLTKHYCTDAVYANVQYGNGTPFCLGNSRKRSMYSKNSGIQDDFSEKYYYVTPQLSGGYVSAYMTTDFNFVDDVSKNSNGHADSGGGWHNATLIKYVDFNEVSSVVGTELDDQNNKVTRPVYKYQELSNVFDNTADSEHKGYHQFKYTGGLGHWSPAYVNTTNYLYMAARPRNMARLYVKPYGDSAAYYMREKRTGWSAGGQQGPTPPDVYSMTPSSKGGHTTATVIRSDDATKWTVGDGRQWQTIDYTIDVLNENIETLRVSRDMFDDLNLLAGDGKSYPTEKKVKEFIMAEISSGYALTAATVAGPKDGQPVTLGDCCFMSCPRLRTFKFEKNVNATGVYTFAAPDSAISYIESIDSNGPVIAKNGGRSHLKKVEFYRDSDQCTHIEGYSNSSYDYPGATFAMFSNCKFLEQVNLENTDMTELGSYTFYNCENLVSVQIPNTCRALKGAVFQNCKSLSCIIFPSCLSSFKTPGKVGTVKATEFTTNTVKLLSANSTNNGQTGYRYVARTAEGASNNYIIDIKLLSASSSYGGGTLDDVREQIFPEISALVNYLNTQGLGCTKATVWNVNKSKEVTGVKTWGQGRRYYLRDKDGNYITFTEGVPCGQTTDRANNNILTFNTIATSSKVPVKNMIVPAEGQGIFNSGSEATAYCIPYC